MGPVSNHEWTVMKALIDAQSHTNACMEQYLLYATHEEFGLDDDGIETCLEEAIESHERAIEDLEVAREALREDRATRWSVVDHGRYHRRRSDDGGRYFGAVTYPP
ncbi:hypothetical protein [Halopenitus persicus]|uniref:hypothetical protein n=1 Tax=Halopenitus persicus TaxID=1048396 RepID=UPI000BBB6431|nr:hypothetical protein [Halopenitus persicus]